jgi:putative DNA methylase
MNIHAPMTPTAPVPLSLSGTPSFIETQFPVGRISAEAYKERKAGAGQTLTGLGSYWKGRKPLLLVRACILGCLMPASEDASADLRVFLLLMGMADESFAQRIKNVRPADVPTTYDRYDELVDRVPRTMWRKGLARAEKEQLLQDFHRYRQARGAHPDKRTPEPRDIDADWDGHARLVETRPHLGWNDGLTQDRRNELIADWLSTLPYDKRLAFALRPEEVGDGVIKAASWAIINAHLGISASSFPDAVRQLGIRRFGHVPVVADTFSGSGSIPFEAARMGCRSYASDLNPIACLLGWGAFNVVGARPEQRIAYQAQQARVVAEVDQEIQSLEIEHDACGNRAKAFLYCLETKCPKTGWLVPMAPSWVISRTKSVIARLVPDPARKRYDIEIVTGVSEAELRDAEIGTLRSGRLVHPANPESDGVSLSVVRGDHKVSGQNRNKLRLWALEDFKPRADDIFQERLYCIQWATKESLGKGRPETFFASVTAEDLAREATVERIVSTKLGEWQKSGIVPSVKIEPGEKTDELIRTRGWTHWHHLFSPRHLLILALLRSRATTAPLALSFCATLNLTSKLTRWSVGSKGRPGVAANGDFTVMVFSNQALNTLASYSGRAFIDLAPAFEIQSSHGVLAGRGEVTSSSSASVVREADLFVTDPPYADAVNYHEITEFFISWLQANPPKGFDDWVWSSQRSKAVKGTDEKFRSDMVAAYRAMARHMPDDGMQVVMFTHQDAGVWADLAAIMWAAGLRVTAAWNIVTETESALKEGNYVQGTILLVLRKRLDARNVKKMDIEGEIEDAVDHQLAALHDIDADWTSERLYTDGDLQLAAYAAALRVITGYATIDRKEVGADVYRKLAKGEKTVIRELIEYAASVANNKLVPEGFPVGLWRDIDAASRFYVRMLDMEAAGTTRFADYQNFARTFSVADYTDLMDSTKANAASLAGALTLKGKQLGTKGFGSSPLRRVLFAVFKTMQIDDPKDGISFLKTEPGQDYWAMRGRYVELARYVALKTATTRPKEASAADLLAQRLEVDRV